MGASSFALFAKGGTAPTPPSTPQDKGCPRSRGPRGQVSVRGVEIRIFGPGIAGPQTALPSRMTALMGPMHHVGVGAEGVGSNEYPYSEKHIHFPPPISSHRLPGNRGVCRFRKPRRPLRRASIERPAHRVRLWRCVDLQRPPRIATEEHARSLDGARRRQPAEALPADVRHARARRRPGWVVHLRSQLRLSQGLRYGIRSRMHLRPVGLRAGAHLRNYGRSRDPR